MSRSGPIERVLAYHERTKHRLDLPALAPEATDWALQPDPFRTFAGAPRIDLPCSAASDPTRFGALFEPGAVAPRPVDLPALGAFFELALAISGWKEEQGGRWSVRCNPSSGNLHPTEAYALLPALGEERPGVHHYTSRTHALERRCTLPASPAALPEGAFLVVLTSIHWRESWKYGERGYRYCQLDAGHAIASLRYAAAAMGWTAHLAGGLGDDVLAGLTGIDRDEDHAELDPADREAPVAALLVGRSVDAGCGPIADRQSELVAAVRAGRWAGRPNGLSQQHEPWPAVDDVDAAARKPATREADPVLDRLPAVALTEEPAILAARAIRGRRSAVAFDPASIMPRDTFYRMLDRLLPRPGVPPWDALPWEPLVQVVLFVHRVAGISPSLYVLERSPAAHDLLLAAMTEEFVWTKPQGCPEHLRLHCLGDADPTELADNARVAACEQDIAADGAFSLAMLAPLGPTLRERGAWWYRRLHWEAGILGQALYLEAEAAGQRGTAIGCYFDDPFHSLLGIVSDRFQDLCHFAVGRPLADPHLSDRPAYETSS